MINRRNFLSGIIRAGIAAAVLPAATTYARRWVANYSGILIPNPEWINAEYEMHFWVHPLAYETLCVPIIERRTTDRNPTPPTDLAGWRRVEENWPRRFKSRLPSSAVNQVYIEIKT